MNLNFFLSLSLTALFFQLNAQGDAAPHDWPHMDITADGVPGMSTQRAYEDILAGKTSQTVIVAVIDSGVDYDHEDLAANMWVNPGEIANNGIDDDGNGYIDDIHGWNFIGGSDGENINSENLEIVRLYVAYKARFEGVDVSKLSKSARREYDLYKEYEEIIESKRESIAPNATLYGKTLESFDALVKKIGKDMADITLEDVKAQQSVDGPVGKAAQIIGGHMADGGTFAGMYGNVKGAADYYGSSLAHHWNPEFDARHIVGDNPADLDDTNYGNNDVEGPDASHGTHVAGTIAAIRDNGMGLDGVATNVKIMSVRAVPDGDERDKDVANAIIYAVDNGASVINMSFGKGQSPYKEAVDEALRYATENDVVLVHAAGNDGKENVIDNNFPNDQFARRGWFRPKYCKTWIEVGAMSANNDADMTAGFSNWSADRVDVFAPGVEIFSTVPNNGYASYQGTSMAAPHVAGMAALLRSYFPDLSAEQVKEIIMDSSVRPTFNVNEPGSEDTLVPFSRLCVTGGVANTYKAIQMAIQTRGRKRNATATRDTSLSTGSTGSNKRA